MLLSQNFIKDPFVVKELLSVTSISQKDLVIEIGPGRGIITQYLVKESGKVFAIEKDPSLYSSLLDKFKDQDNLKIINGDFLKWNLPNDEYKLFSNIPFNITAQIIDKLLKANNKAQEIYFILQSEAAEKYEGLKVETQNSILAKVFYDIEILGDIDRTAFTPKPQVKISFIKFKLKKEALIEEGDYQSFRDFVIYGFNQWKSDIFNAYKKVFSYQQFKIINKKLKINNLKPSQLSLKDWLDFFDIYQQYVSLAKKDIIDAFEDQYQRKIRVKK